MQALVFRMGAQSLEISVIENRPYMKVAASENVMDLGGNQID